MALIGIEYVDHFADERAAGPFSNAPDVTCPYYIANWFGPTLAQAGHQIEFLRSNHSVNERHMHEDTFGGDDGHNADSVDLYLIITHGRYEIECLLLYDTDVGSWEGHSRQWRLGDNCNLEWLLIYGCRTIDPNNILEHRHVFRGLHLFCGAYGLMYDSWSTEEVGADIANNLVSGKTVADSWGDGASDWYVNNHPMVISVER
ncbi:MAG: hypothetical protein QOE41_2215, partial [Mycobacterium sp.]|nr:hypothetical protein [Mycobacterium sp.]